MSRILNESQTHKKQIPLTPNHTLTTATISSSFGLSRTNMIMTASSSDLKRRNDHQKTIVKPLNDLPPELSLVSSCPFISKLLVQSNQDTVVSDTKNNASLNILLVAQPQEMQDLLFDQLKDKSDLSKSVSRLASSRLTST